MKTKYKYIPQIIAIAILLLAVSQTFGQTTFIELGTKAVNTPASVEGRLVNTGTGNSTIGVYQRAQYTRMSTYTNGEAYFTNTKNKFNFAGGFDVSSTSDGFLVPRMTTAQRNAMAPEVGEWIYNLSTGTFNWWTGATWSVVGTGGGTVTSVSGTANQISSTGGATPAISLVSGGTLPGAWLLGTPTSVTLTNATGLPEGGLSLTDITTSNTSTSAHGFFPKLTSNSIYYVNNSGALTALTVGASGTVLTGNGVTSAPTWNAASSGITIGSTTITSGTDNRILFQDATASDFVTQIANFTMGSVAAGYLDVPTGYAIGGSFIMKQNSTSVFIGNGSNRISNTATRITAVGVDALNAFTSGSAISVAVGINSLLVANNSSAANTAIGDNALQTTTSGNSNVGVGYSSGFGNTTGNNGTYLGTATIPIGNYSEVIALGSGAVNTASNQCVIGGYYNAAYKSEINAVYIGNGVTNATPSSVTINATGGSGTDKAGGTITYIAGKGTGNVTTGGEQRWSVCNIVGASGTAVQDTNVAMILRKSGILQLQLAHNNAAANGDATNPDLRSGTYTPTLSNTTNVAASTPRLCTWSRVGNMVTITGQFDIDPTLTATSTVLGISLPSASNFTTAYEAGGGAWSIAIASESAGIQANATTDVIEVTFIAVDLSNHTMAFQAGYEVK